MPDLPAETPRPEVALEGSPGELCFTLQITRANTGKVETYDFVSISEPKSEEKSDV